MRLITSVLLTAALLVMSAFMMVQADVEAGSCITFGSYEQDNDPANGAEPIEWLVLETDGSKALLLSHYGLDVQPYNVTYVDVTWETCTLRAWLNSDFLGSAFTAEEQAAILMTDIDNSDSQGYDFTRIYDYAEKVTGGNDTQDQIFLLSYAEVSKYFRVTYKNDRNTPPRVAPTEYALQKGAGTNVKTKTAEKELSGWWWLRSPGTVQSYAARVCNDGSLGLDYVSNTVSCVRPALWINLEADIF